MGETECTEDFFSFESSLLSYQIIIEREEVILRGEEIKKGEKVYSKTLLFSAAEEEKAKEFYRILLESRTFPQMMEELAEEFFV